MKSIYQRMKYAAKAVGTYITVIRALDLLAEDYERATAVPVTANMNSDGIFVELHLDELFVEMLEPQDIAEISPQAYAMLRKVGAIPATTESLN